VSLGSATAHSVKPMIDILGNLTIGLGTGLFVALIYLLVASAMHLPLVPAQPGKIKRKYRVAKRHKKNAQKEERNDLTESPNSAE